MTTSGRHTSSVTASSILVVEDDGETALYVRDLLAREGHGAVVARSLGEARRQLRQRRFDLLVVDRMLPDGAGLEWVGELRRGGEDVPVLVLVVGGLLVSTAATLLVLPAFAAGAAIRPPHGLSSYATGR